jgi:DNA-directed RNA polymerase specialized sigma24 family protein
MTCSDEVAKDIVQDTFINIWDKGKSLADVDNPSAYFFTAFYRRVYHHCRKVAQEKKLLWYSHSFKKAENKKEDGQITYNDGDN